MGCTPLQRRSVYAGLLVLLLATMMIFVARPVDPPAQQPAVGLSAAPQAHWSGTESVDSAARPDLPTRSARSGGWEQSLEFLSRDIEPVVRRAPQPLARLPHRHPDTVAKVVGDSEVVHRG